MSDFRQRRVLAACLTGPMSTVDPVFEERYRAISARDSRFDGQFYTAVTSTGIYCRPSCPARTPRREHVVFHLTAASAHEAGFRACKRCLPEAAPGTPAWNLRGDVAARAMRLLLDGELDRGGVPALAERLGYSPRHLSRILVAELGAGPAALARAHRAQIARSLLVDTDLPLAQVAHAAGFGSVRQFNDTVREVFAVSPSQLRAQRPAARRRRTAATRDGAVPPGQSAAPGQAVAPAGVHAPGLLVRVALPTRPPFDAPGVFDFLARRAVAGVEHVRTSDDGALVYARTLSLPHGPGAAQVTARCEAAAGRSTRTWSLHAELELTDVADLPPALARIRRLFDLDADPEAVDAALCLDPALAPRVRAVPGIRVPGAVDGPEIVVRALVGQQISVQASRTHLGRLVAAAGTAHTSRFAGLTHVFPAPQDILAAVPPPPDEGPLDPHRPLRLPRRSITAVRTAARALASGELPVHPAAEAPALRAGLLALPGVGPWTAAYVAMRVLGDPDAWLPGDVALLHGAAATGAFAMGSAPRARAHRELAAHAQRWAPWRSYAALHLWRAAALGDAPPMPSGVRPGTDPSTAPPEGPHS